MTPPSDRSRPGKDFPAGASLSYSGANRPSWSQEVYRLVSQIPPGRVATYGQLAAMAGHPRAARIVGQMMARAPQSLPCHRVVYGNGALCRGAVFLSPAFQRQLLEEEGVPFLPDGRIDLAQCLFSFPGTSTLF